TGLKYILLWEGFHLSDKTEKKGFFHKFLDVIERVGNKLPDPFALFIGLAFLIIIISWIFSLFDASVIHPGNGEELPINRLLSGAGLQFILTSMLDKIGRASCREIV